MDPPDRAPSGPGRRSRRRPSRCAGGRKSFISCSRCRVAVPSTAALVGEDSVPDPVALALRRTRGRRRPGPRAAGVPGGRPRPGLLCSSVVVIWRSIRWWVRPEDNRPVPAHHRPVERAGGRPYFPPHAEPLHGAGPRPAGVDRGHHRRRLGLDHRPERRVPRGGSRPTSAARRWRPRASPVLTCLVAPSSWPRRARSWTGAAASPSWNASTRPASAAAGPWPRTGPWAGSSDGPSPITRRPATGGTACGCGCARD